MLLDFHLSVFWVWKSERQQSCLRKVYVLGFHCILWQLVLNIIRHSSVQRNTYNRLWIIFSRLIHVGNLRMYFYTLGKSCGIINVFDRIHFVWPKLVHALSRDTAAVCYLYSQFMAFPAVFGTFCHIFWLMDMDQLYSVESRAPFVA